MTETRATHPTSTAALRYLLVGACNTLFGYACFALLTLLLNPFFRYGYVVASVLANLIAITFSFLGYKWFVFKTQGNYLKEWIRCLGVYASSVILSTLALPFVVAAARLQLHNDRLAPYIGGAIVLAASAALSFLGHRHISFGGTNRTPDYSR